MSLGIGVMLGMLSSNEETVSALKTSFGKTIKKVWHDEANEVLKFEFTDGTKLEIWDNGQSCCETRYMKTDDELKDYVGAVLIEMELKESDNHECEWGDHEVQFLDVKTDKGVFQISNHNEHNGYYGGFLIAAKLVD